MLGALTRTRHLRTFGCSTALFSGRRLFHGAATRFSAAPLEQESQTAAPARQPSAAPQGTVLKGINYLKDGKDPVALDDNEYPDWLWGLLDERKIKQKSAKPSNRQYHRKQNREAIKAQNFMKDKKT